MSADNWAICPKCKQKRLDDIERKQEQVQKSYGKVSAIEYSRMLTEVNRLSDATKLPHNLREDYELGIDEDGTFSVSYEAGCRICGFRHFYKYQEKVL